MVQFLQLDPFLQKSKSDAPGTDLGFSPKAGLAGALRATSQRLPPGQHCLTPEKEPQLWEEVVVKVAAAAALRNAGQVRGWQRRQDTLPT